jgi:predicted transposase YbfD/YdcC
VHLVSAWAQQNGLVLGQIAAEEKSNEITAIPALLEMLALKGCIVTIDAMGCQRDIAAAITKKKADYLLVVKDNQPTLHEEVRTLFDSLTRGELPEVPRDFHEESDKGHGRIETRRCWTTSFVDWFTDRKDWSGLATFVCVQAERVVGDKHSTETRYFISSLPADAKTALRASRSH